MYSLAEQLTKSRRALYEELKGITDRAAAEHRDLTPSEATRFDEGSADMDAMRQRLEQLDDTHRADAEAEQLLTMVLGKNAGGRGSADPFAAPGSSWLPSRREYAEMTTEQRATGYSNASGVLLTQQFGQWFDRLRARSVVLAAGPRLVRVEGHALSLPQLTASATVGSYLENATITASDPTVAAAVLTPKKFGALVLASNESTLDSEPALRQLIADDLIRTAATAIDVDLLVGDGSGAHLTGLRNISGVTASSVFGTNGAVPSLDALADVLATYEATGADPTTAAWFMSPAIWSVIRKLKDGQNRYMLAPDPTAGSGDRTLFGIRTFPSANVPQNETKGTASGICSTVILADMSRVVVGIGQDVNVRMSEDFAFSSDQTAIRMTARLDVAAVPATAVVVATGAKAS